MPDSIMPWVKIYNDFIHDPKIGRLSISAQLLFVKLIVLAGEEDVDGYLSHEGTPYAPQDIAWQLHIDESQTAIDIECLKGAGLITDDAGCLLIINFSKRQGRPQSEKRELWRIRKAKSRANEEVTRDNTNVTRDIGVTNGVSGNVTRDSLPSSLFPLPSASEKKEKSAEVDINQRARNPLFDAIAEVTASNVKLMGKRIGLCASELSKIDATPEQVKQVAAWYSQNDWRGKKGEKLTFATLIQVWDQGIRNEPVTPSTNGKHPPGESNGDKAIRMVLEKHGISKSD